MTTAEAASFASQFWDRKVHPTKDSQQEFLATCIDVDLQKNVKHAQWQKYTRKRGQQTTYFVRYCGARRKICKTQFLHYFKISRRIVETVAKEKAHAAVRQPHEKSTEKGRGQLTTCFDHQNEIREIFAGSPTGGQVIQRRRSAAY